MEKLRVRQEAVRDVAVLYPEGRLKLINNPLSQCVFDLAERQEKRVIVVMDRRKLQVATDAALKGLTTTIDHVAEAHQTTVKLVVNTDNYPDVDWDYIESNIVVYNTLDEAVADFDSGANS